MVDGAHGFIARTFKGGGSVAVSFQMMGRLPVDGVPMAADPWLGQIWGSPPACPRLGAGQAFRAERAGFP